MNLRRVLGEDAKSIRQDNHLTRPGRSQDGRTVLTVLTVGKTVFQDGFQDGFHLSPLSQLRSRLARGHGGPRLKNHGRAVSFTVEAGNDPAPAQVRI